MKFDINKFIILIVSLIILITASIIGGVYYFKKFPDKGIVTNNTQSFIASGIVPHHLLAKKIIQNFFEYIFSKENPETIILLSPDHFNSGSLCKKTSFITLEPGVKDFKTLKVDSFLLKNLIEKIDFCFNNSFVRLEHGITNLLPYIKNYSLNTKILPILIPSNISEKQIISLTEAINSIGSSKTIIIASVDFSHYLPSSVAEFHDVKSIRTLINFQKEDFKNLEVDSWQALYAARAFASLRNKEFHKVIGHSNSTDFSTNKDIEETTSYFSVVFEEGNLKEIKEIEEFNGRTVLFIGDIMLDRGVEYLMNKNSVFYPFEKINQFLRGIDIVIGNLEGPIVKNPPNFSDESLKFAFSPDVIRGLSFANFNLLSLANNHTLDIGEAGLEETKEFLIESNINFIGHPIKCDKDFSFEKDNIIFLAFNKTFPFNCPDGEIIEIVKRTKSSNPDKFLVVIFHWGEEYQSKSSISQQKLAHQIIDTGADLIIGSHSHVVQEIEEYKNKLIFYSLGNFIFDQYFSKETQQGLVVGLEVYPEKVIYRLFPIQSLLSQPFLMKGEDVEEFLEKLAFKSYPQLFDQIKSGIIKTKR